MSWNGIRRILSGKDGRASGFLGWLLSKHCFDLFKTFVILTSVAVFLIALSIGLAYGGTLPAKELLTAVGVIIATWVTLFQFLSNAANARAGVAAVFESEISSIAAVINSFSIVPALTLTILEDELACELLKIRMKPRGENYMEAFARNVDKLANLPNEAVRATTAFYTYLKASRDAARVIGTWTTAVSSSQKRKDVEMVLTLLKSCLEHGKDAVAALAEDGTSHLQKFSNLIESIDHYVKTSREQQAPR